MARRTAAHVVLVVVACAAAAAASAQSLQRLTIQSFVLSTESVHPQVDVPFRIIVTLRVRERVSAIADLNLPMLAQLELLGDERQTTSDPHGTQYREIITVVAHTAGPLAIAAATLQAVDARDGKPKQWFTNDLVLSVGTPPGRMLSGFASTAFAAARIAAMLIGVGIAIVLAILFVRRRRAASPQLVAAAAPAVPEPPALDPREAWRRQIDDALVVLRAERSRAAAVRVRAAIWHLIGASEGETLADVLRRPGSQEALLRTTLISLERSAFTHDGDLPSAVDAAVAALERYAEAFG